jgi:hypothetical protein
VKLIQLVTLGVLSAAVACENSPLGPEFDVTMTIEDSVVARRSPNEVQLDVFVRLRNDDSRTVFYDYDSCGHALQKREGNGWRTVFSPACPRTQYSQALLTGEGRIFSFRARAALDADEWPAVGAAGEYRVVLWLTDTPRNAQLIQVRPLGPVTRTSPVFSVREEVIMH